MTRIGIIGAGQLGKYLCLSASQLGCTTTILANNSEDVAVASADHAIYGPASDLAVLDQLIAASDVVTFEYENVPDVALQRLDEAAAEGLLVSPEPRIMRLIKNKALQKQWLSAEHIPTAEFLVFDKGLDTQQAQSEFGQAYVIKAQVGGYDGKGVEVVRNGTPSNDYTSTPCIVERLVEDKQEIAVLVARNANGESVTYPTFSAEFDPKGNVVHQVVCPAAIPQQLEQQAIKLGSQVVDRLDGIGVFAVEMFVSQGELLINEISPRVHNVGHLTIEGYASSQFDQHILAVSGQPLAAITPLAEAAAMNNLLYSDDLEKACNRDDLPETKPPGVHVHWYGKNNPTPLRKMGHITSVAADMDAAKNNADQTLLLMKAL